MVTKDLIIDKKNSIEILKQNAGWDIFCILFKWTFLNYSFKSLLLVIFNTISIEQNIVLCKWKRKTK